MGRIPLCSAARVSGLQLPMKLEWLWGPFQLQLCFVTTSSPQSWKVTVTTTAGEQGQAAGLRQAIGQGRVCFCAGHKERSLPGTKRVKNVSLKAFPAAQGSPEQILRPMALAGSRSPSERSRVPPVPSVLSEGTSPLVASQ